MCEIDFDGDAVLLREHRPTARKLHRCRGCGGPIKPGRQYLRRVSVFDARIHEDRLCRACDRDSARFFKEHGVGWATSDWMHFLEECVVDDGADADPRWKMMLVRARERAKQWTGVAAAA